MIFSAHGHPAGSESLARRAVNCLADQQQGKGLWKVDCKRSAMDELRGGLRCWKERRAPRHSPMVRTADPERILAPAGSPWGSKIVILGIKSPSNHQKVAPEGVPEKTWKFDRNINGKLRIFEGREGWSMQPNQWFESFHGFNGTEGKWKKEQKNGFFF